MESFNEVLNKRLNNLNKLASDSNKSKSDSLQKSINKIIKRLDLLEDKQRIFSINNKTHHSNNKEEYDIKIKNILQMIEQLSERINYLEFENNQLNKKIASYSTIQESRNNNLNKLNNKIITNETKQMSQKSMANNYNKIPLENNDYLGLLDEDLKKMNLKGKLDEEESAGNEYISKQLQKSYNKGLYQTWTGKIIRKTNLPEFTITLYGFSFKSNDSAKKHFKQVFSEIKKQKNHMQEQINSGDESWIFEKPTNNVLVNNKEFEINKAETVFITENKVYNINISYLGNNMSTSDLKTIVAFLCKK